VLQTNQRATWIWLSRPQTTSMPLFLPVFNTYHTLICVFQVIDVIDVIFREEGKENIWFGGMSTKMRFVSHMLENETVLQSFWNSIRNQEHQSCYIHFLDLITLVADATGMTTRQMSRRMQLGLPMAPWYDATCRDYKRRIRGNKKKKTFAELQQQYSLPAEKKTI